MDVSQSSNKHLWIPYLTIFVSIWSCLTFLLEAALVILIYLFVEVMDYFRYSLLLVLSTFCIFKVVFSFIPYCLLHHNNFISIAVGMLIGFHGISITFSPFYIYMFLQSEKQYSILSFVILGCSFFMWLIEIVLALLLSFLHFEKPKSRVWNVKRFIWSLLWFSYLLFSILLLIPFFIFNSFSNYYLAAMFCITNWLNYLAAAVVVAVEYFIHCTFLFSSISVLNISSATLAGVGFLLYFMVQCFYWMSGMPQLESVAAPLVTCSILIIINVIHCIISIYSVRKYRLTKEKEELQQISEMED